MPSAGTLGGMPFHFWSATLFVFGTMVGSFLNVCIHRLPLGQSIVSPPSHCPHCNYRIPWTLNIPLVAWLALRGKCRNCGAAIAPRYFLVELLTGLVFLGTWLTFGARSVPLALAYCLLFALFIAATFIDFDHYIIPDEITLGGAAAGFLCCFVEPLLQHAQTPSEALLRSGLGIVVGAGMVYAIVRFGKLLFGRQKITLPPDTRIVFTEHALVLPDREVPYEELFYRKSDTIAFRARQLELPDRCYKEALVELSPERLVVMGDVFNPEQVYRMEAFAEDVVLPREAMGLGDVKFMASIGAFLGAPATVFSLVVSAFIGSVVGVASIALGKREWSSRLPYGPYIALAATMWVFGGDAFYNWWLDQLNTLLGIFGVRFPG